MKLRIALSPIRSGISMVETLIAMAVMGGSTAMVAQFSVMALEERSKNQARAESLQVADNILERASDRPWADLTNDWAKTQKLTDLQSVQLSKPELTVVVEAMTDRPTVKKVTVELKWEDKVRRGWQPIRLTGCFSQREKGGKP